MKKFPLYNYKSIKKLSNFLGFKEKPEFNAFIKEIKFNSKKFYKIYTLKNKKNRKVFECNALIRKIHIKLGNCFLKLDTPEYLFSGVKKKSYIHNAKRHRNSNSFYIIDISKFYPSITKEKIYNSLISSFVQSHNVADAISDIITIEHESQRFLVTGSPLSQIVAYFINKPMFDKIQKVSKKYDILFSVYVDDLTFSSKKKISSKFKYEIQNIIEYYGYRYSTEKIQSTMLHERTKNNPVITGVAINHNSKLDLPLTRKQTLEDTINSFVKTTSFDIDKFFVDLDKVNGLIVEAIQINEEEYLPKKDKVDLFIKDFLTKHQEETKAHIISNCLILRTTLTPKNIEVFSKKYLSLVTKTTRLINIIGNKLFKCETHKIVNNLYKEFSNKNKNILDDISSKPTLNPLLNKIILDYKKNSIY